MYISFTVQDDDKQKKFFLVAKNYMTFKKLTEPHKTNEKLIKNNIFFVKIYF